MTITNESISQWICDYMADPAHNTMKELPLPAFDMPLVGFSAATDPYFAFYKEHIDPNFYRLPTQWLESTFSHTFDPENVSIISWVLPHTEDTRKKSAACTDAPTMEWEHVRVHGEECNRDLAKALETFFNENGIEAVAPMCSPEFSWGDSEKFVVVSNWSERHTAFISGLGTFGLCDGLISKKGKAARYGSVIVNCKLTPTERTYTEYNEYCQAKNGCTACIRRCPAGAITPDGGHDKNKCRAYHAEVIKPLLKDRYGYEGYAVCGLCQTGVPCECKIPTEKD
ncbi:MAG: epoxyqueuosine reductase [Clostridia bacterium]|nr:epoxyqueuosine reductase [Clostridia bacterium]